MILRKLSLLLALAITVILSGCDIVEGPKKDYSAIQGSSSQKVLLEEFTGHRCPNCPAANEEAQLLDSLFDDNFIIIALHSTDAFAAPVPSLGYYLDMRTSMGEELVTALGADDVGLPAGAINRRQQTVDRWVWKHSNWATLVTEELAKTPSLGIDMVSTFDSISREVSVTVDLEYFEDQSADNQLVVVITEDSLVGKQLDLFTEYEDYVFNHVLRASLTNGSWGEPISTSDITVGDRFSRTLTYTLPADWNEDKCYLVAYVHDFQTRTVLQAEEIHLH